MTQGHVGSSDLSPGKLLFAAQRTHMSMAEAWWASISPSVEAPHSPNDAQQPFGDLFDPAAEFPRIFQTGCLSWTACATQKPLQPLATHQAPATASIGSFADVTSQAPTLRSLTLTRRRPTCVQRLDSEALALQRAAKHHGRKACGTATGFSRAAARCLPLYQLLIQLDV